jgi:hypothetical protein
MPTSRKLAGGMCIVETADAVEERVEHSSKQAVDAGCVFIDLELQPPKDIHSSSCFGFPDHLYLLYPLILFFGVVRVVCDIQRRSNALLSTA